MYYLYFSPDYDEHWTIELPQFNDEIYQLLVDIYGKGRIHMIVKGELIKGDVVDEMMNKESFIRRLINEKHFRCDVLGEVSEEKFNKLIEKLG